MTDQQFLPEPDEALTDDERQVDVLDGDPLEPTDARIEGEDYLEPLLDDDNDDDVVGELDDAVQGGEDA